MLPGEPIDWDAPWEFDPPARAPAKPIDWDAPWDMGPPPRPRVNWQTRIACYYAYFCGWRVFPCRPADKRPLIDKWQIHAERDFDKIEAWWRRWPTALIGVPAGAGAGFIVVDVDIKDGKNGAAVLANAGHRLGRTWTSRTRSGGIHAYFRHPGRHIGNKAGGKRWPFPGVDIRGDGGYVIAPGVRDGYHWTKWRPGRMDQPAAMPAWLDEALAACDRPADPIIVPNRHPVAGTRYVRATINGIASDIESAPPGCRNQTLAEKAFYAGRLAAEGRLPQSEALQAILAASQRMNQSKTTNGVWDPRAALDTARRCFMAGASYA